MPSVLVLGAGLVARPLVRYLLEQASFAVTVASRTVGKAHDMVGGHARGRAAAFNIDDSATLERLVADHDLTVSLLPYTHHVRVAKTCLAHRKHMVTTSYVSDAMRELDGPARAADVILLNEIGVDPGIDHMSAMKVIHRIQNSGGVIRSFTSWCGGVPAPEANTNPLGYKFSWSPRGVIMAGRNSARFLRDGKEVSIPGEELFDHFVTVPIPGLGDFEGYPNRNSLPYIEAYGISSTESMFRGTLRYPGWCTTLKKLGELGLFSMEKRDDLAGLSFSEVTELLTGSNGQRLREDTAAFLGIAADSRVMSHFAWLGFFGSDPLPAGQTSLLDVLTARMLELMPYLPGERDMLILKHEFVAAYPDRRDLITSTLIDFGVPYGDTAMSRTVSLPAAIGVRLILQGEIGSRGVQVPVIPQIYEPVLAELETLGIRCVEREQRLD
jgi:saccharopine dehydrogenase (NADP+, L-glutamate forming)